MTTPTAVADIVCALDDLARGLATLETAGEGIPAVAKNVTRLRGTLNALQIQFADLAALDGEGGGRRLKTEDRRGLGGPGDG